MRRFQRNVSLPLVGLILAAALVLLGAAPAAATKRCGDLEVRGSFVDHIRATKVSCRRARSISRRYLRRCAFSSPSCSIAGYSCRTTRQVEELRHARCVKGDRVIRFNWGS